jgi:hypothetical protein
LVLVEQEALAVPRTKALMAGILYFQLSHQRVVVVAAVIPQRLAKMVDRAAAVARAGGLEQQGQETLRPYLQAKVTVAAQA